MQEVCFEEAVERVRAKDQRYQREAYLFVRDALEHTRRATGKNLRDRAHVTGQELLAGIRDYALAQFGPMAMAVFEQWGIHTCPDFGEIVFNLIEVGQLSKTKKDSRADFADGYDFWEAFRKPFLPSNQLKPCVPDQKSAPASSK